MEANDQIIAHPRLWISYPWIRTEEADFNYLVPQLKKLISRPYMIHFSSSRIHGSAKKSCSG